MKEFYADTLRVHVEQTRAEMGAFAAREAAEAIRGALSRKPEIRMIFAAAPSQNEFLENLLLQEGIDWSRITALHMDEYVGLPADAPQGFGNFLRRAIFGRVPFHTVHYLNGNADPEAECARYSALLREAPVDIVCMGIGENGHVAFNDPPVADFHDSRLVKPVPLDEVCRMQQVHDGCFASLDQVPKTALTLTVPALFAGEKLFCVVPAETKAKAVFAAVTGPVSETCPASVLRRHSCAALYLDAQSAALLDR